MKKSLYITFLRHVYQTSGNHYVIFFLKISLYWYLTNILRLSIKYCSRRPGSPCHLSFAACASRRFFCCCMVLSSLLIRLQEELRKERKDKKTMWMKLFNFHEIKIAHFFSVDKVVIGCVFCGQRCDWLLLHNQPSNIKSVYALGWQLYYENLRVTNKLCLNSRGEKYEIC
jgi:hypothetical protein